MRSLAAAATILCALPWAGCTGPGATAGGSAGAPAAPVAGASARAPDCRSAVPEALRPPPGHALALQLEATGVQIYTCAAAPAGIAWTFTAPEASLRTPDGKAAGRHSAGPTWEALDGSSVVGARVAGATPDPAAIPWLLLRATAHGGAGALSRVAFVQRIATAGGLAPAAGCSEATLGAVARVPYAASYCLLVPE